MCPVNMATAYKQYKRCNYISAPFHILFAYLTIQSCFIGISSSFKGLMFPILQSGWVSCPAFQFHPAGFHWRILATRGGENANPRRPF